MATTTTPSKGSIWEGGKPGMKASWGKLMMWFFLVSDAFTFSAFLISYGVARFSSKVEWANPEEVFTHFPGLYEWFHFESPLTFVGLMTFILIASSVTMVLAVEAGHRLDKKAVEKWMIWTIIGGIAFLGCQAYEWFHFIHGVNPEGVLRHNVIDARGVMHDSALIRGAGMRYNEYTANPLFANFFFFVTGFHGSHVASGVILNILVYFAARKGNYARKKDYEMVEKVGLYWHFVDLVWVFVFTFFYLI